MSECCITRNAEPQRVTASYDTKTDMSILALHHRLNICENCCPKAAEDRRKAYYRFSSQHMESHFNGLSFNRPGEKEK